MYSLSLHFGLHTTSLMVFVYCKEFSCYQTSAWVDLSPDYLSRSPLASCILFLWFVTQLSPTWNML